MHIYILRLINDNGNNKFTIGLENESKQIDINISHYNTEIFVSPLCGNHNQNSIVNQSIIYRPFKIKLKSLMNIIMSYKSYDENIYFKDIFYYDYEYMISYNKYDIILCTNKMYDLSMTYNTLSKLINKKIKKDNHIKTYDLIKDDIYISRLYDSFNENEKLILIQELDNIEFEKNEIKCFYIHFRL